MVKKQYDGNKETEITKIDNKVAYETLAEEVPIRDLELPEGTDLTPKSLTEKLEEVGELSDMRATLAKLFPEDLGNIIYNKVMVGRIAPDVFIPLLRLMVVEEIMQSDPKQSINVVETMVQDYVLLSIGLDGKGRIDQIELAGASKETEELEKLGKGLFGV